MILLKPDFKIKIQTRLIQKLKKKYYNTVDKKNLEEKYSKMKYKINFKIKLK